MTQRCSFIDTHETIRSAVVVSGISLFAKQIFSLLQMYQLHEIQTRIQERFTLGISIIKRRET